MDTSLQIGSSKEHCAYCFDVLIAALDSGMKLKSFPPLPESIPRVNAPLFVTWHIHKDDLRGCIGTFASESIEKNLPKYTVISAFQDTRFDPISKVELPHLSCAVSLLTNFEQASNCYDWEVGKHGINIEFDDGKNGLFHATFLPEVAAEQGWNKEETLTHLIRKAGKHFLGGVLRKIGFRGKLKDVEAKIGVERYQSSKIELTYDEYCAMRGVKTK